MYIHNHKVKFHNRPSVSWGRKKAVMAQSETKRLKTGKLTVQLQSVAEGLSAPGKPLVCDLSKRSKSIKPEVSYPRARGIEGRL